MWINAGNVAGARAVVVAVAVAFRAYRFISNLACRLLSMFSSISSVKVHLDSPPESAGSFGAVHPVGVFTRSTR